MTVCFDRFNKFRSLFSGYIAGFKYIKAKSQGNTNKVQLLKNNFTFFFLRCFCYQQTGGVASYIYCCQFQLPSLFFGTGNCKVLPGS